MIPYIDQYGAMNRNWFPENPFSKGIRRLRLGKLHAMQTFVEVAPCSKRPKTYF